LGGVQIHPGALENELGRGERGSMACPAEAQLWAGFKSIQAHYRKVFHTLLGLRSHFGEGGWGVKHPKMGS